MAMMDLLIKNGSMLDGLGSPALRRDIGVMGTALPLSPGPFPCDSRPAGD
jgi:hypothetical protein